MELDHLQNFHNFTMDLCLRQVFKKNSKKIDHVGFLSGSPRFNQYENNIIGPG